MVTRSTDPGWTPIFGLLGGLIMESGGQLSHGAVVAREYGLPAVAGIAGATQLLHDDQVVLANKIPLFGVRGISTSIRPGNDKPGPIFDWALALPPPRFKRGLQPKRSSAPPGQLLHLTCSICRCRSATFWACCITS